MAHGYLPQSQQAHFVTAQDYDVGHITQGWEPVSYNNSTNGGNPGDHSGNVGCRSCHRDNNQNITFPSSAYAGSCAACHASNYDASEHNREPINVPKLWQFRWS